MSRYSKIIKGDKEQDLIVNWGFDHILGYWYDIHDDSKKTRWGSMIEERSSYGGAMNGSINRGDFLVFLERIEAPEEHKNAVGLDYPF